MSLFRFCEKNFVGEMETTIGVDFYLSEIDVNGKKIKVAIMHFMCSLKPEKLVILSTG